jgi:AcrR family transcriptional regulator
MTNTSASGRPLRADAVRNRRAVVDAAYTAFRRDGVNTSLDDIAKAAGVGSGTLYRHFATRDALVAAVIEDQMVALLELGESLMEEESPIAAVEQWLRAYVDQAGTIEGLAGTLLVPSGLAPSCDAAHDAGVALIERAIGAGALAPDTVARDLVDLAAGIAMIGELLPSEPERTERLLQLCLGGARLAPERG